MIIQFIKFKTELSEEEILNIAKGRESQFKSIPGLLQKYYVKPVNQEQYGGIYVWDSVASLEAYRASDLAAGIPKAYEIIDAPDIEIMDVLFQLRN